jgi:hypothetical protein
MTTTALNRAIVNYLLVAAALPLNGCWTAPTANVQPKGDPRVIQRAIAVESVKNPAIVKSVDPATRTIIVQAPGETSTSTYTAGPGVSNLDRIKTGDKVQVTVAQDLTVYVSRDGQLPGAGGASGTIAANAKVLSVDRSYRLLRLQYPNGQAETFKVGREVKLDEMEPGDDVVIGTGQAVALRVKKR